MAKAVGLAPLKLKPGSLPCSKDNPVLSRDVDTSGSCSHTDLRDRGMKRIPRFRSSSVRFHGKEGSSWLQTRERVSIVPKKWNQLGGADFSAAAVLWPRMVLSGGVVAAFRPSIASVPVGRVADDRFRGDDWGRLRAEASRGASTADFGLRKFVAASALREAGGIGRTSIKSCASRVGEVVLAEPSSARRLSKKKEIILDQSLIALREEFEKAGDGGIDAYIVPSQDPHQSEFIADCFQRRSFVSGFTGSSGTAVVTKKQAALWTDGRYFLQAEKQLNSGWTLMRQGTAGVPSVGEWLCEVLPKGSRVGIDPFLFSADEAEELRQTLRGGDHKLLLLYDGNLVDKVWGGKRPNPPTAKTRVHDIKYAGADVASKILAIRKTMSSAGATALIVSMLDEVAWVLNVRGGDVPHSPVTYSYLLIEEEDATLFVDEAKVTPEVAAHLKESSVTIQPYDSLVSSIQRLAEKGAQLWLDPKKLSVAVVDAFLNASTVYYEKLSAKGRVGTRQSPAKEAEESFSAKLYGPAEIMRTSPVSITKALKNSAELEGMRQAHLRDAAALAEFWAWLEHEIVDEKKSFTEVEVADRLEEFRAKQPGFLETSFDTICGSGPNGAIVHYRAEPSSCAEVNSEKLLLLDSGAQFVDGTTDITRTVHFGTPSPRQMECFTRVLQGHIAVDKAVFPENTPGFVLDVLARSSLWRIGLDYRHGTGHGVGAALNVHEGPQSISSRFNNMTALQAGMIVSNEPGYYEDRSFGIRIENLLIVRELDTPNNYGGTSFLGFERLTFVPIQTKLLDLTIMSEDEIDWLNSYHEEVWEKVSPLLKGEALAWLRRNTELISNRTIGENTTSLSVST